MAAGKVSNQTQNSFDALQIGIFRLHGLNAQCCDFRGGFCFQGWFVRGTKSLAGMVEDADAAFFGVAHHQAAPLLDQVGFERGVWLCGFDGCFCHAKGTDMIMLGHDGNGLGDRGADAEMMTVIARREFSHSGFNRFKIFRGWRNCTQTFKGRDRIAREAFNRDQLAFGAGQAWNCRGYRDSRLIITCTSASALP